MHRVLLFLQVLGPARSWIHPELHSYTRSMEKEHPKCNEPGANRATAGFGDHISVKEE